MKLFFSLSEITFIAIWNWKILISANKTSRKNVTWDLEIFSWNFGSLESNNSTV